jgi:AraC-like DNA-binding protein
LAGGKLAIYFSKKNYMPVERLLSMLKIQKEEMKDSSFNQIYQSLENSLQKLITGQENLYHRINNIDSVVEKYVITNLMRGWNQDDGWAEEYLLKIREKYPIVNYRIILFSFNHVEQSLFANEQKDANRPIDNPLMVFSIENVINEMVLKYEYNNNSSKSKLKGLIIEMGDMTACIVNVSDESMEQELQNSVQRAIDFFRSAFKMDSFATISGIHSDYEELSIAYEEALMALTHKSFWGSHLTDIVLFDNEKAAYSDNFVGNKLILQAKKLSNCLLMKDYSKASDILDETLEKCFSRDINRLAYNQYQASALVCIIFSNLSENVTLAGNVMSGTDWTSSDRILSMKSLEDIRVNLHSILDEFAAKYEETSEKSEEPEWLQRVEKYTREHYVDSDINISLVADKFHISLSHLGRTFKKYRGVNMLDYIHELRIKRAKELMNQGVSVTDCAAEIGYVDAKSFIRAFKRCEGITPGQYKSGHME